MEEGQKRYRKEISHPEYLRRGKKEDVFPLLQIVLRNVLDLEIESYKEQ